MIATLQREFLDARRMDNMALMAEFPDKYFELAIVDPPYGIGVGNNKSGMGRRKGDARALYKMGDWDSEPPPVEYFEELRRVSENQIVWGANHFIDRMPIASPCWLVWDKRFSNEVSFADVELAHASFSSVSKKFTQHPNQLNRIHPTQKPVALYNWILKNYAKPGDKILDTHLGSGSIAIACHYARLHLTACELDEDYFAAFTERYERETAQDSFAFAEPTREAPREEMGALGLN